MSTGVASRRPVGIYRAVTAREESGMRFAIGVPNVGAFGDPDLLVELAVRAEHAGWDGWFLWDHLLYHESSWPVVDPIVVLSAVASVTERIRLGVLMLALPRRRPWKVAKELATVDRLSAGRLITGFGLGSMDREYAGFGEEPELKARAEKLDEGLDVIVRSWTGEQFSFDGRHHQAHAVRMLPPPAQKPRPPIWLAGRWPNKSPFARAARWDGVMPIHSDYGKGETMPPQTIAEIREFITARRGSSDGFDIAVEGTTDGNRYDPRLMSSYQRAGLTWWVEALGWWRGDAKAAIDRVLLGPQRPQSPT